MPELPIEVMTMTSTVPALCAGVITEICDDEFTVNGAGTVPNITAETELNPVPLIVRLQGTNAVEAKQLIDDSGLPVHSAITLEEAANKVKEVLAS